MMRKKWLLLLLLSVGVLALLVYYPSSAGDDNRAALVVDFGNGQVTTRCVAFSEETISGFDLLQRSGLPMEVDFQSGGAAVCRIDGQGCPPDDCFCACRGGGDCVYWAYWHQIDGVWGYSSAGSTLYQVGDGAVEGWVWGLGSVTQATPPPAITYGEVCAAVATNTPTVTPTPSRTATPVVLPTALPTTDSQPAATAATTVALTSSPRPTANGTGTLTPAASTVIAASATPATRPTQRATPGGNVAVPPTATVASAQPVGGAGGSDAAPVSPVPPAAPETDATAATLSPTPDADNPAPVELPAVPTPVFVEPAIGLTAIPAAVEVDSSPTAAVVAVVGQNAVDEGVAAPPLPTAPDAEAPDLLAYAGFAGLLLLLGAFALAVYRRRSLSYPTVRER